MYPFINIFGHTFQSYWIMVGWGIIVGISISCWETKRKQENIAKLLIGSAFIILIALITSHVSSYLFWVPGYILKHPLHSLQFWSGGLTLHGGLAGAILAGLIFSRIFKIPFGKLADIYTPSIPLGQTFGRIGCFLNGCCYGVETNVPWAITFTNPDSIAPNMVKLHPTQLYEAIGTLIIFFIIWNLRKKVSYQGGLFLHYLIMYSILRAFVSTFRADSHYIWGTNIRTVYIVCLLTIIIAKGLIYYLKRVKR